ncbi:MAG: ATP-binding protein [Cyanobacteria bacterium P01_F01_bin.143]
MEFSEILAKIALRIRQSLNLEQILHTTVAEVRPWLDSDRVMIYRFNEDWSGIVMVESVSQSQWSIVGSLIADPCFKESWLEKYRNGRVTSVEDIHRGDLTPCHVEFLEQYQIQSNLVVPILLSLETQDNSAPQTELWGLIIAHECSKTRQWKSLEVDFLQKIATQVEIAIKQAILFEQLQQTNHALAESKADLETKVRDRTQELELVNRQLVKLNQELTRSNKELEQFAYIVSHDLREPLRMVTSFTQLLGQKYSGKLDADADQIIGFAVDGATRMEELINDLLAYSRVGNSKQRLELVNTEEILDRALSNLQLAIQETNTQISREHLPPIVGNPTLLIQLWQNLIANAIKYRGEASPRIEIGVTPELEQYLFWVKDNGIGIDPKHRDRIFQIFQRLHTRQEYPGTGTGLAICQKIMERHGGKIWVESELSQGATFYFTFPIKNDQHSNN